MKSVVLGNSSLVVNVDDCDFDRVRQYAWHLHEVYSSRYARTRIGSRNILMHRFLVPDSMVDHRDGDGLNNQRGNLRASSCTTNQQNRRKFKGQCPHKGVQVRTLKTCVRYRARIVVDGRPVNLGTYKNPIAAAIAYDTAARKYFGEFSRTNFKLNP